jgi:ABC-type hemin transport system ATPase subunit
MMSNPDRPVMLDHQYGPSAPLLEAMTHLEAMHQHQLLQAAQQSASQAVHIARLHQDLDAARSEIDRLTGLLRAAGAYLHDGPENETP